MNNKLSRRNFIKLAGFGIAAASLGRSPAVLSALAVESEPVDVMILGSGFGGAVTALRLAEQGIHTVMLERGKRWPVTATQDTFSSLVNPDGRSAWISDFAILGEPIKIDKYIGVLELTMGNGIASLSGAGVGGGSLVYAGALYQPTRALFDNAFGGSVRYDEMDSIYYPRVKSVMKPSPIPQSVLAQPEYNAARMWKNLGDRAGLTTKLLELGVTWNMIQEELRGTRVPSITAGEFWYGNNSDAKFSLDKNYLKYAEESGYLQIETQQNILAIQQGPDNRYIVIANEIDTNGSFVRERKYVVKKLFIAAGSIGTSKLLVKSKAKGWLPNLNNEVGRYWGNNGDFFSQLAGMRDPIQPNLGGPVTISIEDYNNPIAPVTVECYADWRFAGVNGLIPSIGMSTSPAVGYFSYDAGIDDVILNWPLNNPDVTKLAEAGAVTYNKIADAWGVGKPLVRKVKSGHIGITTPVAGGVTAHPLGGAVINRATDNFGRVKNHNGLYVCDGALVPGNTGCTNPALTIAALAERNIEQVLARDFF